MQSFDTNIAVYAANANAPQHAKAFAFIESLVSQRDVAVCELMLVELYLKLCNGKIFAKPLSAPQASAVCQIYRDNRAWSLIEDAPIMHEVWPLAAEKDFSFRRIIDVRLAKTLLHHGVTRFATANVKDFEGLGFEKVWNPLI